MGDTLSGWSLGKSLRRMIHRKIKIGQKGAGQKGVGPERGVAVFALAVL